VGEGLRDVMKFIQIGLVLVSNLLSKLVNKKDL